MGNLTLASWAILTTHGLWFCSLAVEMSSFWAMRRKLKIHARSPMLAVVSGFGGSYMQLVIMLFELFAQEGVTIPCKFMLYSNVVFMTFYPLPYLLRGLRVVIVSDKVWRSKYSTVLSRRNVFLMLFMAFVVFTGIAVMLQFVSQNIYGPNPTKTCFAIADWWLYGPVCMICAGISSKLFLELSRVQDRINMSKEISSAAIAWLVTSVPFYLAFILNDFGVMVAPRPTNFLVSICVFLTGLSTFFIEPRRSKGVIHIFAHHKKKIAVVMDEPQILAWKEKWHNSRVIMNFPPLDHAFEKHVQDYLCSESYDFLKELDRYIEKSGNMEPEKQFEHFREIVNMYIMPGSELEVNIETAMRNKILKIGDHDNFIAAEVTMKRDIFNPSGTEIRKMLDENLLKTFLVSPAFLNVCKHVEEEAGEAESSISTMVDANQLDSTPLVLLDDKMREEDVEESEVVMSLAKASLHFN